jgi:hypothetical protein
MSKEETADTAIPKEGEAPAIKLVKTRSRTSDKASKIASPVTKKAKLTETNVILTAEQEKERVSIQNHVDNYDYDESILKRRKKKLQGKGVSLSVPKKSLTAYAIFVKKVSTYLTH